MVDVRVAGATEPGWPEPGSAEELARFAALQEKLEPLARKVISDPRAPQTVVVVPSLTLDAEELAKMGFAEIQFDYIRFPEPYASLPKQVFPNNRGVAKPDVLASYLKEANARLDRVGARTTADIFGLVTTVGGPLEVGQHWERISPVVDGFAVVAVDPACPPLPDRQPRLGGGPLQEAVVGLDRDALRFRPSGQIVPT